MCISVGHSRRGFSLVEMVVAMGLTSILMLAVAAIALNSTTSLASINNYLELNEQSRFAAGMLANDLRTCLGVTSYSTNSLAMQAADGSTVSYTYNSNAKRVTRTKGSASQVVLEGCTFIQILIHQRNPVGGAYDVYPAANAATCKVVKVNWSCTKAVWGSQPCSENMSTGYIVIRNP